MSITLILGGARSGKSSFAEKLACVNTQNVGYIATAQALDEEMQERIALHRKVRPKEWITYEEPLFVSNIINNHKEKHDVFLLDCLTLLISNIFLKDMNIDNISSIEINQKEMKILNELKKLVNISTDAKHELIIVSNEVGLGLVPSDSLSRGYRDIAGRANQFIAGQADRVIVLWAGIPLQIKPSVERISI